MTDDGKRCRRKSGKLQIPRPFLKWVGGKTQLLAELRRRIPESWDPSRDLYIEPFVGAGALYWDLKPRRAVLNDACAELVCVWEMVRDRVDDVVGSLRDLEAVYRMSAKNVYQGVRAASYTRDVDRAARTIFLNKTCFNGLYRVNRSGSFNVGWCKNPAATIVDEENLLACSALLRSGHVRLCCEDFAVHLRDAAAKYGDGDLRGALVYLDPPYTRPSDGRPAGFVRYTSSGFDYKRQIELSSLASELRECGAHVIVSQSVDPEILERYERLGFRVDLVQAVRRVNSQGHARGEVGEYIIW